MSLFYADFISLVCASVQEEKQWWITAFDCKETKVPADWDDPLPSDVALMFPRADRPMILLSAKTEVQGAGYERQNGHVVVFCTKLKKAREFLSARNIPCGPLQSAGTQFFEVRDPEGNTIEICQEP